MAKCIKCGIWYFRWSLDADGVCVNCRTKGHAVSSKNAQVRTNDNLFGFTSEPVTPAPRKPLRRFYTSAVIPPEQDYTVIDTETSGLDACTSEILEIGAIRYRNKKEVARFHSYVKPLGYIPKTASDVNHITWNKVCNEPDFFDILPAFLEFIGEDTLVGYNIGFDIKFIQTRSGLDLPNQAFDVLPLAKATVSLEHYKLDDLRKHFWLRGRAHTAIGDCITTSAVYQRCLQSTDAKSFIQKRIDFNNEQLEYELAEKKRIDEIKAKKEQQKEHLPPLKELHIISAKMEGAPHNYTNKVLDILKSNNVPINNISVDRVISSDSYSNIYIRRRDLLIFSVKLFGRLKYVILPLSPDDITCRFPYGPTSIKEGENWSRIYISSPDDLNDLTEYIVASYKIAQEKASALPQFHFLDNSELQKLDKESQDKYIDKLLSDLDEYYSQPH